MIFLWSWESWPFCDITWVNVLLKSYWSCLNVFDYFNYFTTSTFSERLCHIVRKVFIEAEIKKTWYQVIMTSLYTTLICFVLELFSNDCYLKRDHWFKVREFVYWFACWRWLIHHNFWINHTLNKQVILASDKLQSHVKILLFEVFLFTKKL